MSSNKKNKQPLIEIYKASGLFDKLILFFATWFFSGFIPFAPGTWGSLAALPFAAVAYSLGPYFYCLSLALIFIFSIPISGAASKILKTHDASSIVIDEVAGIFITLFLIPISWTSIIAGFILFRIFDIIKPFPIGLIDRKVKGGTGIVLDDIMAGIYSNICLRILLSLIDYFSV